MSEVIEGVWWELIDGEQAVAILSQKSGYQLNRYYINNLVRYGRIKPALRVWKYSYYKREDVEALPPIKRRGGQGIVRKRGKCLEVIE